MEEDTTRAWKEGVEEYAGEGLVVRVAGLMCMEFPEFYEFPDESAFFGPEREVYVFEHKSITPFPGSLNISAQLTACLSCAWNNSVISVFSRENELKLKIY